MLAPKGGCRSRNHERPVWLMLSSDGAQEPLQRVEGSCTPRDRALLRSASELRIDDVKSQCAPCEPRLRGVYWLVAAFIEASEELVDAGQHRGRRASLADGLNAKLT